VLMMTPEFRRQLRAGLASSETKRGVQPVTLPTLRAKRKERRLQQLYRRRLIDQTAMILRKGSPSVFAFEGFMTNGLRAGLCLRGWSWPEAHKAACEIVRLPSPRRSRWRFRHRRARPPPSAKPDTVTGSVTGVTREPAS